MSSVEQKKVSEIATLDPGDQTNPVVDVRFLITLCGLDDSVREAGGVLRGRGGGER